MNTPLKICRENLTERYKKNLTIDLHHVYSYGTKVALINHQNKTIKTLGWWSVTTSKHINYVGKLLGYDVIKKEF